MTSLLNGVQMYEEKFTVSEPYQYYGVTKYRERQRSRFHAHCPRCGWEQTDPNLPRLRQAAYCHDCEDPT